MTACITSGARARKILEKPDGTKKILPNKADNIEVENGDQLHFITWGGGGWGDPLERDPATVALEVRRGLITRDGTKDYGVVLAKSGAVDEGATKTLRDTMRAARPAGPLPVFNYGPGLAYLREHGLAETGLPVPRAPR